MKKVVIHRPGGYERLRIEEFETPCPGKNDVLIATKAIGINYADVIVRWGLYESAKKFIGWPITPGFEFSGVVEAVGDEVTGYKPGDEVFGITLFNGYASHVLVSEKQVFSLPKDFSLEQSAGFPAVFLTAYHALFQNIVLRPGMQILIHSAAGGVGTALVQLAKIAGCSVTGVVGSSSKVEYLKSLGPNNIIDKSTQNLWAKASDIAPKGYDIILDANGVSTLKESYNHLAPCGKLIVYGFHSMLPKKGGKIQYGKLAWDYLKTPRFNPINMCNENKSIITFNLSFLFNRADLMEEGMNQLLDWANQKRILPPKVTSYTFNQVAKAHKDLESGNTIGKLVLFND